MAQTRERILEKVVEILATPDVELTVAEAATRARVSVRTAYRYFPTKEALVDAFNAWSSGNLGIVSFPRSLDEIVEFVGSLARSFAVKEAMLRATQRTAASDEVRQRRKASQARAVTKLVDEGAPGVDPAVRKQAAASILAAVGFDAWVQLRDVWGMDAEQCVATMQWNVGAVLAQLAKASGKRR